MSMRSAVLLVVALLVVVATWWFAGGGGNLRGGRLTFVPSFLAVGAFCFSWLRDGDRSGDDG